MSKVIFGLGSNLNNPVMQLQIAINRLNNFFKIQKISSIYVSQSLLKDNQEDYYNIVATAEINNTPTEVLFITQSIEKEMGRLKLKKWGERIIDIDIIDYNGEIIKTKDLEIPHNQMIYRSFVLEPLKEIMPEYIHPILKLPVKKIIDNLTDDYKITICQNKLSFL